MNKRSIGKNSITKFFVPISLLPFLPFLFSNSWMLILFPLLTAITIYFYVARFELSGPTFFYMLYYLVEAQDLYENIFLRYVPVVIYVIIVFLYPRLKQSSSWLKRDEFDRITGYLIIFTIITSAAGLLIWFSITNPELSDLVKQLPQGHPIIIILVAIAFATINAIMEEITFRGVLWDGLKIVYDNKYFVIITQGLIFGLAHYYGFPRGFSGVILAAIYGIMLGVIRYRSKGLLVPTFTHIFADLVIYFILFSVNK